MPTFYEFFAGGGMVRAGLGGAWRCLIANDLCEKKARSYIENWGGEGFVAGDIHTLSIADVPGRADLAWGSFPCQDLSLAGAGAGLDGQRSGAFWGLWSIIRRLNKERRKPSMIMLENVYGILTSRDGKDVDAIAQALAEAGYVFGAIVIDAIHFVPQSRPRVFIFAVDETMRLPDATHAWIANPAWHPAAVIRAHNRLSRKMQVRWRWWNPAVPETVSYTLEDIIETSPQGVAWHSVEETAKLLASMSDINRRKVMMAQAGGTLRVGAVYRRTRDGVVRAMASFAPKCVLTACRDACARPQAGQAGKPSLSSGENKCALACSRRARRRDSWACPMIIGCRRVTTMPIIWRAMASRYLWLDI